MCYILEVKKTSPAKTYLPAPARLAKALAALGYDVTLKITRSGKQTGPDKGAQPMPVDAEITDKDIEMLKATLAAYAVNDRADKGPKFKAPKK